MDSQMDPLRRYLAERANQPFGDVEMTSGRVLQPFSVAGQWAATNLLGKAARALESGDLDRAEGLVDRAARLPFDEHEESAPAAMAGQMVLFDVMTDALEDSLDDDQGWLDAAVEVLSTADEVGKAEIRQVLLTIDQDYEVTPEERHRIREVVRPLPRTPELRDEVQLSAGQLAERVMSILVVAKDYTCALATS